MQKTLRTFTEFIEIRETLMLSVRKHDPFIFFELYAFIIFTSTLELGIYCSSFLLLSTNA